MDLRQGSYRMWLERVRMFADPRCYDRLSALQASRYCSPCRLLAGPPTSDLIKSASSLTLLLSSIFEIYVTRIIF